MISGNYSFASVQKYIPLVLCAIPFLPFTAHKVLFSKTFYATVDHRIKCTQMRYLKGRDTKEALCIYFIKDNGKKLSVIYQLKDYVMEGLHYQDGDRGAIVIPTKAPNVPKITLFLLNKLASKKPNPNLNICAKICASAVGVMFCKP